MDSSDNKALIDTLELVGINRRKLPKIIAFSPANKQENKKVHEITNKLILDLIETNDLGECIHVTGEMRALTDPFHRRLCEEMRLRDKGSFHVLYNIPEKMQNDAISIVNWNLTRWTKKSVVREWTEELRSIDVIANCAVDLFAYNTENEVQYSVFGDKYIQLQEKHNATEKRIWLLESDDINSHLVDRGKNFIGKAIDINQHLFREFTLNLSGVAARRYLSKLSKKKFIDENKLLNDAFVRDFAPDPKGALDVLKTMEFVIEDAHKQLSITTEGREFLKSY